MKNADTTERLRELERVIARWTRPAERFADAYEEIRDNRLYRESYPTFEEYWQKRWRTGAGTASPSPRDEGATAYHEAGHAVMKARLGLGYSGISIVPDKYSWGRLKRNSSTGAWLFPFAFRGGRWHRSRLRAEKWVMVLQAGDGAQRHYDPPSGLYCSRSDFEICVTLLRKYDPDKKNSDVVLHYDLLKKWTESLIEQYWHLVEAVAKALLVHHELSATQVRNVIHAADQKRVAKRLLPAKRKSRS